MTVENVTLIDISFADNGVILVDNGVVQVRDNEGTSANIIGEAKSCTGVDEGATVLKGGQQEGDEQDSIPCSSLSTCSLLINSPLAITPLVVTLFSFTHMAFST